MLNEFSICKSSLLTNSNDTKQSLKKSESDYLPKAHSTSQNKHRFRNWMNRMKIEIDCLQSLSNMFSVHSFTKSTYIVVLLLYSTTSNTDLCRSLPQFQLWTMICTITHSFPDIETANTCSFSPMILKYGMLAINSYYESDNACHHGQSPASLLPRSKWRTGYNIESLSNSLHYILRSEHPRPQMSFSKLPYYHHHSPLSILQPPYWVLKQTKEYHKPVQNPNNCSLFRRIHS